MFETFDHTADLGLRVRAADLNELFAEAARALFSTIVDDSAQVLPAIRFELEIAGSDREYLLFDWLRELLFRFETEHLLCAGFQVNVSDVGLSAVVTGELFDPARHTLGHEVKAITYHGLTVVSTDGEWLAEFIVDI